MNNFDLIVIGAGAAGCFGAINAATNFPEKRILILERADKALQKVRISGGGRCNVTNVISDPVELSKNYPRGQQFLKKAFHEFSSKEMVEWMHARKVPLKLYPDGCYFPVANNSQVVIDCFMNELTKRKVAIHYKQRVHEISQLKDEWKIETADATYTAKKVLFAIGGQAKETAFELLKNLNLKIVPPVPSLFTFNMPNEGIKDLMGIVTENASVKIHGDKNAHAGPLLITHWGMSGPAILKTSAFQARKLAEKAYQEGVLVNWCNSWTREEVEKQLKIQLTNNKFVVNTPMFSLKSRLWALLVEKAGIHQEQRWSEIGTKKFNKLFEILVADHYKMEGKTTFKEEFVTAGGIDLSEIDVKTMESKRFSGLFFAGEAMDIDGITGGFNFQSAWTTAFIAGKNLFL